MSNLFFFFFYAAGLCVTPESSLSRTRCLFHLLYRDVVFMFFSVSVSRRCLVVLLDTAQMSAEPTRTPATAATMTAQQGTEGSVFSVLGTEFLNPLFLTVERKGLSYKGRSKVLLTTDHLAGSIQTIYHHPSQRCKLSVSRQTISCFCLLSQLKLFPALLPESSQKKKKEKPVQKQH